MDNDKIKIVSTETISDHWFTINKVSYDYKNDLGESETIYREVYGKGNAATILLYNPLKKTIILTKQFRLPTYMNGNPSGMLIETCAGFLDKDSPEDCAKREAEEETGYRVTKIQKIFESYMSPGALTELLHFFIAEYDNQMKVSDGGGLDEEQEHIEVLELEFNTAYNMIYSGEIKDSKTIMLLQYAKIHHLV